MAATVPPDVSLTLTVGPELDVEQLVVDTTEVLVTTVETPLLLSLGVVQGEAGYVGPPGPPGDAATCDAGSTATSPPGSFAKVTNVGSKSAAIFDFEIPQGIQGPQGNPGTGSGIVSADAGNTAVIGSDTYIYVPHDATKLALAGGTMTGPLTLAADPTATAQASTKNYVDVSIADLNDVYVRWVPFTGPPQSFLAQDLTRDGDWTMVANKNTSDRPAPQPTGTEEDLLPAWTPVQNNVRATFIVRNEFTLNQAGWINRYGVDVNQQNAPALHAISLMVNGVVKDSISAVPGVSGMQWQNITPLLVSSGAVVRVSVQVTQIANNLMYWDEQAGLFATPPNYCSLAQGWRDANAPGTTAYDCHCIFSPGSFSPDWDVVAFGGTAAASGGIPLADTTQSGLLQKVSGLTTDFVDGTNNCQALAPQIWSVRLRSYNAIGNPSMEVDQRNAGNSTVVGASTFGIDRWQAVKNGLSTGAASAQQTYTGVLLPGTNFYITSHFLTMTVTAQQASLAATDILWFNQVIEGPMMREIGGDVHSVSLLVRSSVANLSFGLALRDPGNPTRSLTKLCTLGAANTWTLITLPNLPIWDSGGGWSFSPGTEGYQLSITLACGSTYTAPANNTWQNGNFVGAVGQSNFLAQAVNSTFDTAFIQHEPGPVCTTLMDLDFQTNLTRCQRYYANNCNYTTKFPAANMYTLVGVTTSGTTTVRCSTAFPQKMAKVPTLRLADNVGNLGQVYVDTVGISGVASSVVLQSGIQWLTLGAPVTGTQPVLANWEADTGW